MADPLSDFLLGDRKRHASLSPETLELLGKQAANMYLNEGVPLNEGVAKLAGAHADISHEQVKRICEFANQSVYLSKHDENTKTGAASSYPSFPLADPARVIQDLSDGARPKLASRAAADYSMRPEKDAQTKVASSKADAMLGEMFKTASAEALDFTEDTALAEVMGAKSLLDGLKGSLESSGEELDLRLKTASADYYEVMKRHLLNGGDFADIVVAARSTGIEGEKVANVLKPFVERVISEKVAEPRRMMESSRNLQKIAHRVVNPQHPLVTLFGEIVQLEGEISKVAMSLEEVESERAKVQDFIRENFSGRRSAS